MTNIVIYARYSSQAQTEQSIEGQLRVCHEFAERNGYNIINEYIDRALTGTNDNRPAFQQMIEDSNKKEFEYVLVYKLDRFSRSKYDNAIYKHKLQLNGVKVISAMETISNTPEGALMEGLLEMFAEMYSKDLSQKVKRGMRENMLKGNFYGGIVSYGYKVIDKKIFVDEEKAPAIRYIFKEYADGKPKKQIIDELNAKGYRTVNGKPFSYNGMQKTLTNKKYMGVFDNGTIQSETFYPAIIDKETFEKVQARLTLTSKMPAKNKAKAEYILTGKAFCGYCGNSLIGICGTGRHGESHHYYTCYSRHKHHNCKKANQKKQALELAVMKKIKKILNSKTIEFIAAQVYAQYNQSNTDQILKDYDAQLKTIEKELDKCFNVFYNATNQELQNRMNEKADSLSLQKKDILAEIKKIQITQKMQHSKEDIVAILNVFVDGDINDIEYQKRILNNLVNCIYMFDDEIVIYFTLFNYDRISFERLQNDLSQNGVRISNTLVNQQKSA